MALKDIVKKQLAVGELVNQLVDAEIAESVVGRGTVKVSILVRQKIGEADKQHLHVVSPTPVNEGKYARVLQRESRAWNAQTPDEKLRATANLIPEGERRKISGDLERKGFVGRTPTSFLPRQEN